MEANEMKAVIGTVTYSADFTHRFGTEYAGHDDRIDVKAGTYTVGLYKSRFGGHYMAIEVEGVRRGSWSNSNGTKHYAPERETARIQIQAWEIEHRSERGDFAFERAPGIAFVPGALEVCGARVDCR